MSQLQATCPPQKPLLRWAGSKTKLLPVLVELWRSRTFTRYVEPFAGSASLFFYLRPSRALLSDINSALIETYVAVRDHPRAVSNRLSQLTNSKEEYYRIRAQNSDELAPLDRAARFIYLNRFCFNGIYRTNLAGQFNVPYSPAKTGSLPDQRKLSQASNVLKSARLLATDFESITSVEIGPGDFVYLDPPYAVRNQRIFTQYGPDTFGTSDLNRFRDALAHIDSVGASFVASYAQSEEAKSLFLGWPSKELSIPRNVSGFSKHRRIAIECVATNIT